MHVRLLPSAPPPESFAETLLAHDSVMLFVLCHNVYVCVCVCVCVYVCVCVFEQGERERDV